jgi:hypothetical protein
MHSAIPTTPARAEPVLHAPVALPGPLARAVICAAVAAGVAGDLLLHGPAAGLGVPLWIAFVVLCAIALVWRANRAVSIEASAWLVTAGAFSLGIAWRNSPALQLLDVAATVGALGMAAVALRDPNAALLAPRLRDTLGAAAAVVRSVLTGAIPLVLRDARQPAAVGRPARRSWRIVRAISFGAVLLVVFGSLLRSADPIFASLARIPDFDAGAVVAHAFVIAVLTWIMGGWARGALADHLPARHAAGVLPFRLESLDITIALGTLDLLFAAFVAAQLGWFFGGDAFLQQRTGLTAASYAREGFFQMVWVVLLVVPVLVGTRAALRPGRDLARRHSVLSLPMVALLGAMIVSALWRMRLYVHYYGLTTERFYPSVFMLWLGVVLIWLALTVLRGWPRPFIAGAAISALGALAALNIADPDGIVARVNVERARHPWGREAPALDIAHLSTLGGGAVELATRETMTRASSDAERCKAARTLLRRFGPASGAARFQSMDAAWRYWNADDARGVRIVGANAAALRHAEHDSCHR